MPVVLIVDDERKLVQGLVAYFRQAGFETLSAYDGRSALMMVSQYRPDLVVLDLMLPELDGLQVCQHIRSITNTPVIMLTARDAEDDKLNGLEIGADDYITKPFSPREVVARAKAVLRRIQPVESEAVVQGKGVVLNVEQRNVTVQSQPVELTPTEFALLLALMRNAGRTLTRTQLLDAALGDQFEGFERTIDAHIKNLRRKIEVDPAQPRRIVTVFGVGYKFSEGA